MERVPFLELWGSGSITDISALPPSASQALPLWVGARRENVQNGQQASDGCTLLQGLLGHPFSQGSDCWQPVAHKRKQASVQGETRFAYSAPPPRQNFRTPPYLYTPPSLEGCFQGWGGWSCSNAAGVPSLQRTKSALSKTD